MYPAEIDPHARLALEMLEEAKAFDAPLSQKEVRKEHGRRVRARQRENYSWAEWQEHQRKLEKEKEKEKSS